ncbi:unnamed protein product [Diabrotica balteata]|uniref:Acyltransferase 3 domain-containing protein n=1 Tax=Diabrotica balteata TaxID=107213 RepID=A0A9N9XB32_DIABA|nr:unnamed protein product [Diabrotica balteata]
MLPPLYKMENYTQCAEDPSNYCCSAQVGLIVPSTNLNTINIIKNYSLDITKFDRQFIYRTLCVPKIFIKDDFELYSYSSNLVNQEIKSFQLGAKVEDMTCNKTQMEINAFDIICLVVVVLYNILLIFATYKEKTYEKEKGIKYAISRLSFFHTWKLRSKIPNTTDFKNLINMNGGRIFGMLIIILIHVGVANNTSFISEPEIYEKVYHTVVDSILGCLPVLIVLYFFLISSWLLTIQVYNIHEKGQLSLKNVGILIINRYFRLNCTIVVFMILSRTSWMTIIPGPANFYSIIANQKACSENWIPSLFFFVNFYQGAHICNPITWHVSVDFQLYVINLFLLYIKLKLNFNTVKFCAAILTFSMILHGITLQIFDTGPLYLASLRYLEVRSIYHSLPYVVAYMSTSTLWSSSLIEVIFGIIYIKTKNRTIKPNTVLNIIWCSASVGLIYLAIKMGSIKINGTKASLLGCIIRPIFSLGCALGVYGMSHNLGGPIKKLMELKLFVVLSNCLYCVYLVHFASILMINRFSLEPIYFDVWKTVRHWQTCFILI